MQYNIYFRKDVWEKFEKEKDKSKLINKLLEWYYVKKDEKSETLDESPTSPSQDSN